MRTQLFLEGITDFRNFIRHGGGNESTAADIAGSVRTLAEEGRQGQNSRLPMIFFESWLRSGVFNDEP